MGENDTGTNPRKKRIDFTETFSGIGIKEDPKSPFYDPQLRQKLNIPPLEVTRQFRILKGAYLKEHPELHNELPHDMVLPLMEQAQCDINQTFNTELNL